MRDQKVMAEVQRRRAEVQARIMAEMRAAEMRMRGCSHHVLWHGVLGRGLPLAALVLAAVALLAPGVTAPGVPVPGGDWRWAPAIAGWAALLAPVGAGVGAAWGLLDWRRVNRRWPERPGERPPWA
ncbi:MAG TPA: hypothetical protein VKA84_14605 [Gemmatimonadaceae bacterium]|nr:hypothetical protein [Gemmatimonadaceae bacterium]